MSGYKTILFDMDGTITDSKPGILRSIKLAFDKKGISYTQAILDKMVGPPFRLSMKMYFGLDGKIVEELIEIYRGEYEARGWRECKLYDGIEETFKSLKLAGKRLAVATSKPFKFTNMMVDDLGLRKYFDFVGAATSDSTGETKADVIKLCFDALNISEAEKNEVLMVGDRLYDVEGAHQCGIKCAGALWGYGDREEFEEYNTDYIFETPKELASFVLK
jgi:phosphoglycolate phosphatase